MAFLTDGFQTLLTFGSFAAVTFREKEVTPSDLDGGGSVDVTTQRNAIGAANNVRTFAPKNLITVGDIKASVQWDPASYAVIGGMINFNQLIVVTFPDSSTTGFFGWLDKFVPGAQKEGEMPMAEITIHISNLGVIGRNTAAGGLTGSASPAGVASTASLNTSAPLSPPITGPVYATGAAA